jgi:hypothetical protein
MNDHPHQEGSDAAAELARSLAESLRGLAGVIEQIDGPTYASRELDPAFASCVGSHVRHTLDHVRLLIGGVLSGEPVDYEARDRGGAVESDRGAGAAQLRLFADEAARLADRPGWLACDVVVKPSPETPCVHVRSTLARELAFVMSHTVHHAAIVRLMLARGGRTVAGDAGLAHGTPRPSTHAPPGGTLTCAR